MHTFAAAVAVLVFLAALIWLAISLLRAIMPGQRQVAISHAKKALIVLPVSLAVFFGAVRSIDRTAPEEVALSQNAPVAAQPSEDQAFLAGYSADKPRARPAQAVVSDDRPAIYRSGTRGYSRARNAAYDVERCARQYSSHGWETCLPAVADKEGLDHVGLAWHVNQMTRRTIFNVPE